MELKITKNKTYIFVKDHEKDDRFLAAQVEKVESLGDAKAKIGWLSRGTPVLSQYGSNPPPPPSDTHTNPGVAGNIKGFSARMHFKHGAFISLYATSAMQVTPVVLR